MNQPVSLEIQEYSNEQIKFAVNNIDSSMANSLRRIMIAEVPTMAIELVNIIQNTSCLNDEYISHRLGLIPLLSTKAEDYLYTTECECLPQDQCNQCRVFYTLKVKCPSQLDKLEVTSLDLICENANTEVQPVKYKALNGEYKGVLICVLSANQEIELTCEARKGIAKIHSKWSPVAVANFTHEAIIKIDDQINDLDMNNKLQIVNSCPQNVFQINKKNNKIEIAPNGLNNCVYCGDCTKKLDSLGFDSEQILRISTKPDRFIFSVESTGSLKPDDIVRTAFKVLTEKLKEIQRNLNLDTR